MPALEALQDKFAAAHTKTFAISVDSFHCHANWAVSLGGISLPLLADFHPKGAVARSFGLYLEDAGITDRATVILDADGVVRHVSSVTPAGSRDLDELLALCEGVDKNYAGKLPAARKAEGLSGQATLYVKTRCGFSLRALNARVNLHLEDAIKVVNVTEVPGALDELKRAAGKEIAPCLVVNGKAMHESEDIVKFLATAATGN